MVSEIRKKEAVQYINQAEEFLESSKQNLETKRYNVAGFNAIQSMINANDALTIYFLERRASKDHREAIRMHIDVVKIINDNAWRKRLKEALDMRSNAGYLGTALSMNDSEKLIRYATQFISWVRKYVKL